ncbi:hypothetical protein [Nitrosomonas aestuarii]|nr:hypothetical protein [Nitrosomonas aestuarii]PTN12619.1 hypothetical protein C8R11_103187 [Nitrosomonas aestuarii]
MYLIKTQVLNFYELGTDEERKFIYSAQGAAVPTRPAELQNSMKRQKIF